MKQKILEQTIQDFRASSDESAFGRKEAWRIHKEPGPFGADCEDFALTLLWRFAGANEDQFWAMLRNGDAKIIHVISDRGNDHVALWIKGNGYIDSSPSKMERGWRPHLEYEDRGKYTVDAIQDKLADREVPTPDDAKKKKMLLILAVVLGAAAFVFLGIGQ